MLPHFILLPLALLLGAVSAASPSSPDNTTPAVTFEPGKSVSDCKDSTFSQETNPFGSPLVKECQVIVKNIAGGGTWSVETVTGSFHQLVQFGTCAFGVQVKSASAFVHIGNQDIMDVITTSIGRFAEGGRIAATGTMPCQSGAVWDSVYWSIYPDGS
ncbi:putative necrosis-inducing factor-domain-containing protein [Coniochaeta sp. 2T2.1]|nr:putative necrosis-inducing factor-domain-containing protein [Coniochaeta sp. 2T2.1]